MKEKTNKSKSKVVAKSVSVRVHSESKLAAMSRLESANKKKLGRRIKFEDLFNLALGLVTEEHIKVLHERSLTHANRQELLRQRYAETRGPISVDDFIGFTFTAEYPAFLSKQMVHVKSIS